MSKNSFLDPVSLTWERATYEKTAPIRVLQQKYSAPFDQWHRHEGFWEIVLVLSGKAVNEMASERFFLHGGDLFVMPPGSVHHYVAMNRFYHYILLCRPEILANFPGNFESLPNFRKLFRQSDGCSPVLHIEESDMHDAIERIEAAKQEYLNRASGWLEALYAEVSRALVFLLRHANPLTGKSGSVTYQIERIIRHMESHLRENLTLGALSAMAKMSVSNFRLRFHEVTGASPIDYLIRLRLRQAALLLAYTDQPVSEAYQQVGFFDGSYFARQFRAVFGKTAREFRKEVQTGRLQPSELISRILHDPAGAQ